jgi:hypothetical protein
MLWRWSAHRTIGLPLRPFVEVAKMDPDTTDLVKISGTVVDRTNAMFALDDGSGCIVTGILYRNMRITARPSAATKTGGSLVAHVFCH